MFYTRHVRIGRTARIGYFMHPFKQPFWISRKIAFWLD